VLAGKLQKVQWGRAGTLCLSLFKRIKESGVFARAYFWIALFIVAVVGLAWLKGSSLNVYLSKEATDKLTIGDQLFVESLKWGLGFLGLLVLAFYNLHRADNKDRLSRQASFYDAFAKQRIECLQRMGVALWNLRGAFDKLVGVASYSEEDFYKEHNILIEEIMQQAAAYGRAPTYLCIENQGDTYLQNTVRSVLGTLATLSNDNGVSNDFKNKVASQVTTDLQNLVLLLLKHEYQRNHLLTTKKLKDIPKVMTSDLPFDTDLKAYMSDVQGRLSTKFARNLAEYLRQSRIESEKNEEAFKAKYTALFAEAEDQNFSSTHGSNSPT
jgi:hypothetical protein